MTTPILIRKMVLADVMPSVKVHLRSFQGFFLTFLGPAFLAELFTAIISDPDGIGIVSEADSQVAGYAIGTVNPAGFYKRLASRRWFQFGMAALPAFLKKPSILPRLIRAFSMSNEALPTQNCATFMSMGVDPDFQGRGIGKLLSLAILDESLNRGAEYVNLTTDAKNNDSVNRFHQSVGFQLIRAYVTPEGRSMNEYLFDLKSRSSLK